MTATANDAAQAVLLMRWEGGGTALDRDAYLSNTPAGISKLGWAWGQKEQDAESVSFRFDRKSLRRPARSRDRHPGVESRR